MKKKEIQIAQEIFDACDINGKVSYIDYARKRLDDPESQIRIGNKLFQDREELQLWQIERGYIKK